MSDKFINTDVRQMTVNSSTRKNDGQSLDILLKRTIHDFRMRMLSIRNLAFAGGVSSKEKYMSMVARSIYNFACALEGLANSWIDETTQFLVFQQSTGSDASSLSTKCNPEEEKVVRGVLQNMNLSIKKDLTNLLYESKAKGTALTKQEVDHATAKSIKSFAQDLAAKAGHLGSKIDMQQIEHSTKAPQEERSEQQTTRSNLKRNQEQEPKKHEYLPRNEEKNKINEFKDTIEENNFLRKGSMMDKLHRRANRHDQHDRQPSPTGVIDLTSSIESDTPSKLADFGIRRSQSINLATSSSSISDNGSVLFVGHKAAPEKEHHSSTAESNSFNWKILFDAPSDSEEESNNEDDAAIRERIATELTSTVSHQTGNKSNLSKTLKQKKGSRNRSPVMKSAFGRAVQIVSTGGESAPTTPENVNGSERPLKSEILDSPGQKSPKKANKPSVPLQRTRPVIVTSTRNIQKQNDDTSENGSVASTYRDEKNEEDGMLEFINDLLCHICSCFIDTTEVHEEDDEESFQLMEHSNRRHRKNAVPAGVIARIPIARNTSEQGSSRPRRNYTGKFTNISPPAAAPVQDLLALDDNAYLDNNNEDRKCPSLSNQSHERQWKKKIDLDFILSQKNKTERTEILSSNAMEAVEVKSCSEGEEVLIGGRSDNSLGESNSRQDSLVHGTTIETSVAGSSSIAESEARGEATVASGKASQKEKKSLRTSMITKLGRRRPSFAKKKNKRMPKSSASNSDLQALDSSEMGAGRTTIKERAPSFQVSSVDTLTLPRISGQQAMELSSQQENPTTRPKQSSNSFSMKKDGSMGKSNHFEESSASISDSLMAFLLSDTIGQIEGK